MNWFTMFPKARTKLKLLFWKFCWSQIPNWNWSKTKTFPDQNTSSAEKQHPLAGSVQQEDSLPLRVPWKPRPCPVSVLPPPLPRYAPADSHKLSSLASATLRDYLLRWDPGKLHLESPVSCGGKHWCSPASVSSSNATTISSGREINVCK